MRHFGLFGVTLLLGALLALTSCNDVSEDNLNKWMNTERGPDKIKAALKDDNVDPALRATAARNLIRMEQLAFVRDYLGSVPEAGRLPIISALTTKLWEDARIKDKLQVPTAVQTNAKDALFEIRDLTDDAGRKAIDGYLVEWLGGYYEGRARTGRIGGHQIVRAIGAPAAKGLLQDARSILAAGPDASGKYLLVGDNLLYGLALSGSPDAAGFVLDLAASPSKDKTLQDRAMAAMFNAFVKPVGVEPADPKALKPHVGRLVEIIKNGELPGAIRNDAIHLVAAVGMPECLPVFVEMVSYPASEESFRWIGVQQGIRCGKVAAIVPIAEALPPTAKYRKAVLAKYYWDEVLALSPRSAVAERAETLLSATSAVAKVSGVELLGMIKLRGRAAQDAEKIKALAGDNTVLRGWHEGDKDAKANKDPTLGQRAREVASALQGSGR